MAYEDVDLAAVLAQVLAGETGDVSSQINVAQDFMGNMFDPAAGIYQSLAGNPASFDWDQLFEYETPEPPAVEPLPPLGLQQLYNGDENEQMIAEAIEAGVPVTQIKTMIRTKMGIDSQDPDAKIPEAVKLYDSLIDEVRGDYSKYQNEYRDYERAMEGYDPTPKLVETELVQKFRKAGIPLPSERPEYTASDFRPGQTEETDALNASGAAAGDARRQMMQIRNPEGYDKARSLQQNMIRRLLGTGGEDADVSSPRRGYVPSRGQGGIGEYFQPGVDIGLPDARVQDEGRFAGGLGASYRPEITESDGFEAGGLTVRGGRSVADQNAGGGGVDQRAVAAGIPPSVAASLSGVNEKSATVEPFSRSQSAAAAPRRRAAGGSSGPSWLENARNQAMAKALQQVELPDVAQRQRDQLREQISAHTKAVQSAGINRDWHAWRDARNQAAARTRAGRTPTTDAILSRLLGG